MFIARHLGSWLRSCKKKKRTPLRRLIVETLEDRLVPSTFAEVEPNGTAATANAVTIATGDVITTKTSDWLIISGNITSGDADFFQFTLTNPSGVFFDIDSRDTGLSTTLNSTLAVFDSTNAPVPNGTNNDGYDFQGFNVPTTSVPNATSPDSSLYLDLAAGTFTVRVNGAANTTGAYQLRLLADSNYTTTVPVFNSNAGAAATLFLDFDGNSSTTDAWTTNIPVAGGSANGPYTAAAYDFNGNTAQFTPAERLAMFNVWRITAEDFASFRINVSTAPPANFNNGVAYRTIITSSDASIIGYDPTTNLGITFVGSFASGTNDNVNFVFANTFAPFGGGVSGSIMASAVEQGNTASHEFGHALGLQHYSSSTGSAGSGAVLPNAIMATPDIGLNRETWATGVNEIGGTQDDMAVISNATNGFGFKTDDFGNTVALATNATPASGGYANNGIIGAVTDRDFFKFNAAGATTITVNIDEYVTNMDVQLRLYNSAGTQIAVATPIGAPATITMPALAQGTYFVDVRSGGLAGQAGSYSLNITTISTNVLVDALGNLVVTDIANGGKADGLTVSLNGANIRVRDPNNNLSAGAGTTQVDANTVEAPLASITGAKGIVVNANGGADKLTLDVTGGNPIPTHGLIYNGGVGTDTLVGTNADTTWAITGANAGNIAALKVTFTGVETLNAGTGRDIFRFGPLGSLSGTINGGTGTNWLDFTGRAAVTVNLAAGTATGVAGGVQGFNNVIGSAAGHSKLTGNSSGGVLIGKGTGNTINGGAGRSVLIGGTGVSNLNGGAADDLLINGRTTYDANFTVLEAILATWQDATKTYAQRIAALQAVGANQLAIGKTVFLSVGQSAGGLGPRLGTGNFVYQSNLFGNGGDDWFMTNLLLTVLDRAANEVVTLS